jgi:nucleoid-associated protein YgaU
MGIKNTVLTAGLLGFAVIVLAGCTVRTYSLTRDRIDQELAGNRGYLQGNAPAETGERKSQRETRVVEIEFGSKAKARKAKAAAVTQEEAALEQEQRSEPQFVESAPVSAETGEMEKYTVAKGDTLQKISKKFYGTTKKWSKIYNANRDVLSGPDRIYPGQTINVPVEGMKEPKENLK